MKLGAISLVALLALGLFYFVVSETEEAGKELDSNRQVEVVEAKRATRDLVSPASGVSATVLLEKRTAVADSEESARFVGSARVPVLRGRLILTDELGVEYSSVSGELTVSRWNPDLTSHVGEVKVANGEFEVEVGGYQNLEIDRVVLGGRRASLDDLNVKYPLDGEPIVVRVHWPRTLFLAVLDEHSGKHLSQVTIATSSNLPLRHIAYPGLLTEAATLLTNGTSPIEILDLARDLGRSDQVYFVHSPGYSWKTIHLDLTQGGQRELRLEQGGDLVLHLVGELMEGYPFLRLRHSTNLRGYSYLELPVSGESPIEITGILPGKYRASIEFGDWYAEPQSHGALDVVVEAGIKSKYEIVVAVPPTVVRARLAGTLFLPPAWGFTSFCLKADLDRNETSGPKETHILSSSDMEKLAGDDEGWAFDYGEIPTGDYELQFSSVGRPTVLEYLTYTRLEPAGDEQFECRIPPPGTVVIQVFDELSGEPADLDTLWWKPRVPEGKYMFDLINCEAVPEKQWYFEFQAPVGQIELRASGSGNGALQEVVDVELGRSEFTYRVSRECPLVIVFLDGTTAVPIGDRWHPRPEHLDGEGSLFYVSSGESSGFQASLSKPGRYVFEMPELEGFEPIPKQTIFVRSGEKTRYVVKLVRKQ